jgi:hypothetical protein
VGEFKNYSHRNGFPLIKDDSRRISIQALQNKEKRISQRLVGGEDVQSSYINESNSSEVFADVMKVINKTLTKEKCKKASNK